MPALCGWLPCGVSRQQTRYRAQGHHKAFPFSLLRWAPTRHIENTKNHHVSATLLDQNNRKQRGSKAFHLVLWLPSGKLTLACSRSWSTIRRSTRDGWAGSWDTGVLLELETCLPGKFLARSASVCRGNGNNITVENYSENPHCHLLKNFQIEWKSFLPLLLPVFTVKCSQVSLWVCNQLL